MCAPQLPAGAAEMNMLLILLIVLIWLLMQHHGSF
jgi:hypothetical protein